MFFNTLLHKFTYSIAYMKSDLKEYYFHFINISFLMSYDFFTVGNLGILVIKFKVKLKL